MNGPGAFDSSPHSGLGWGCPVEGHAHERFTRTEDFDDRLKDPQQFPIAARGVALLIGRFVFEP